jgi:hypothetical protein
MTDPWALAQTHRDTFVFSTIFCATSFRGGRIGAHNVAEAIDWCRAHGVTKVYIESFRSGYTAPREELIAVRDAFKAAGFDVAGCVTTIRVGKISSNWECACCYTDKATFDHVAELFAYAAALFDLIMIDDFFFTECECDECVAARGSRSWAEYRCDLMLRLAREKVLDAARRVNPNVKIILKYPQWYEIYHQRGYDVATEPLEFDYIWAGTETRDFEHVEDLPHVAQYEGYFVMRWLGAIGGAKCGGGWFDSIATSPPSYLEQATQTILGGAREAVLFAYHGLRGHDKHGTANTDLFAVELPALFDLAQLVRDRQPRGIIAPKPPNSEGDSDAYVFDWVGMLGVPLVPATEVPTDAPAVFLSLHALHDPALKEKLSALAASGSRMLLTQALAEHIDDSILSQPNVQVAHIGRSPTELNAMPRDELRAMRTPLLEPLGLGFDAPAQVALYPLGSDVICVDNFSDCEIEATLTCAHAGQLRQVVTVPSTSEVELSASAETLKLRLPPRTLVVLLTA